MLPVARTTAQVARRGPSGVRLPRVVRTLTSVASQHQHQQPAIARHSLAPRLAAPIMSRPSRSPSTSRSLATHAHSTGSVMASNPLDPLPEGFELRPADPATGRAPYAVFTRPLELSALDERKYRLVKLANGLEVLLISDPETDKASAAMDVRVGHLSDPEELQGLAHFCEHLLFMGTKKYPRENEYSEFLSNHSGSSNAYTGMDNTNYFFDVGHAHLEGALDRFAQFFLEPLFDASCTEREIKAVDSEHKKNLQSDAWRAFQLEKSLSDPAHPYSHFGTGNAKTLWDDPKGKGVDVRDELLKFHERYYSANVMKLVVLGRESLDQLTDWAVDKFAGVRNKGLAAPTFPASPFGPEQLKTQVFFRSVKDIRLLDVTFPIPDQGPQFRSKPGQVLSHFIGHEGQGSILSFLKARGWANHLSAGATNGADGFEFFKISVDLTKDGLAHYESVVAAIFRYIDLLKTSRVPKWSFEEVQQLCDLAFRFKEQSPPSSYASGLATQMQMPFPRDWVVSGPYLTREFDPELISSTADCLRPDNCRVSVSAQQMPDGSQAWDKRERWYGTEYTLSSLPSNLLAAQPTAGSTDFADLALPRPNTFIPSNFDVPGRPAERPSASEIKAMAQKRPTLVRRTPISRLWHKRDDTFFLPKANVFFLLRSPLLDATPSNAVKTRVLVELVKDALTEYSYDADLAGLGYHIEAQADGLGLSVDGYNDKLPVLARYIFEKLASFKVDARRFELIKDQVRRGYQNFELEAPYQHANYYTTYLLVERMWTAGEKLVELEALEAEDVQRFLPDLLGRLHMEVLAHGNVSRAEAENLAKMAEDILHPKPLSPAELISPRSLLLPPGTSHAYTRDVTNKENVNSSIEYYVQVGDPVDLQLRSRLQLMSQMASEPVFDQLRTKEQLGYLVFSSLRKSIGSMGWRILVQSERDSAYVESRIDAFLDSFKAHLEKMTDAEFESHKASLICKKQEAPKNLFEESTRYWFHIHSGYYDFLQRDVDVESLRKVGKKEVYDFFMRFVHHSSAERSKLTVHLRSQVKPARFSAKAADVLQAEIKAQGMPAEDEAFDALRAQQPAVETVKAATCATLQAKGVPAEAVDALTKRIDELAVLHPLADEASSSSSASDVVKSAGALKTALVDDAVQFKADLSPSRAAKPVASWDEFAKEPVRNRPPVDAGKEEGKGIEALQSGSGDAKPIGANL